MAVFAEQQTEWIINNNLVNKQWIIDNKEGKNVFFQKSPYAKDQKKLELVEKQGKYKKPDYILYTHKFGDPKAIAIIEAKRGGEDLKSAMKQACDYGEALNAPLIFCTNGSGKYLTKYLENGKELVLNGNELDELIREKEALLYLEKNTNEIDTIPKEIRVSRDDLIKVFKNLNDTLRGEGIRAGIERFSEFANILFLKLLSENDQKLWWDSIKNQANDHIIGYINGYLIEQIQQKYGGNVFTPVSIKNPQTLRSIIDSLDPLILSTIDTDIKGDAFEYFLEKTTSTENDLGEYFTPRHVVKSVISLVDPKPKETIYDPFCGTGGFLTSAFQYIKENKITDNQEDLDILRNSTLYGRELTTTARIAKMNMILHGDGHSGIEQIDSLANPDYFDPKTKELKKFDIVVTNMPFSQTITRKISIDGKQKIVNEITDKYNNGLAKNSGDGVCVLHCLNSLKKGGRMALVVPEGFLFRKDLAKVREHLLKSAKLQSVISLPQGAFLPYTGVKTDILYFTNAHETNDQKEFWYFDVKNVGFTLDNNRRKIKENDLTKIENSDIRKANKPEYKNNLIEVGFEPVAIEKIKKNDYNFVGAAYREPNKSLKYEAKKLIDLLEVLESGTRPKGGISGGEKGAISLGGEQIGKQGELELSKIPYVSKDFYNNAKRGHVKDKDILICKDGALTGKVCLVDFNLFPQQEVMVNEHVYILRASEQTTDQMYLFYCLTSPEVQNQIKNLAYNKSAQPGLNHNHISSIEIPLPSISEQKEIVEKILHQEKQRLSFQEKTKKINEDIAKEISNIWN